jgi:nitrogenase molybdenum-iron protein alpha/beta subunit
MHIVTGTPGKKFEKRIKELTAHLPYEVNVMVGGDLFLLHQWIKNEPVDLLIGNSYGKYIARDEDLPFLRWGFPILDRVGHQYFPTVGYKGGLRLLEKILGRIYYYQFDKGEKICKQGDPGDAFYVINEGKLHVAVREAFSFWWALTAANSSIGVRS